MADYFILAHKNEARKTLTTYSDKILYWFIELSFHLKFMFLRKSQPAFTWLKSIENTRTMCEVNDVVLVSLLSTLKWFHTLFWCFCCWLWTSKCWLLCCLRIFRIWKDINSFLANVPILYSLKQQKPIPLKTTEKLLVFWWF